MGQLLFRYRKFTNKSIKALESEVDSFINAVSVDLGFNLISLKSGEYIDYAGQVVHTVSITYSVIVEVV